MNKRHTQGVIPRSTATSFDFAALGFEDDIVISYCLSQLVPEEALAADVDESTTGSWLCTRKFMHSHSRGDRKCLGTAASQVM